MGKVQEIMNTALAFCKEYFTIAMDFCKEYYDKAVEYFTANPTHLYIAGGVAGALLLLIIILAIAGRKKRKAKKAAKKAKKLAKKAAKKAKKAKTVATEETVEVKPVETKATPVAQPAAAKKVEEKPAPAPVVAPVEKKVEEKPATVETPIVKKEAPVVEAPAVKEEKSAAPKKAKVEVKAKEEPTPAPVIEPVAEPTPIVEEMATTETKPVSLHDEFKDANTDLNFYEEDGVDQEARYKGKWVICRLITEDNAEEEMFFFELHASNGERLLTSEEYTTYNGAIRGIQTHKNNIAKGNFRITISKRGEFIFKLLNGKNMLLCMGEGYPTKARCESAIASAKRFAETAIIDENIQDQVVKVPMEEEKDTPVELPKNGTTGKWVINCTEISDGEKVYNFELFANNNERLLCSEEYTTHIGAVNGIETHKNNIAKGNFRIVLTKRGDYIYKLLNSNGQLLCLGEHYKTKRLCQNAVESVKRFAAVSPVLINAKDN